MKKLITLEEYIKQKGYTKKEWDDTVDMLCKKGIAKGTYQDYNLLTLVIDWLCGYQRKVEMEVEDGFNNS